MLPVGIGALARCATSPAAARHRFATVCRWFRSPVTGPRPKHEWAAAGLLANGRGTTAIPWRRGFCCCSAGRQKVVPFVLADIGEGISEVTVKEWYVKPGDRVTEFDDVCEVESDKATVTITSRYSGVVTRLHHEVGSMARVGSPLVDIELHETADEDATPPASEAREPDETVCGREPDQTVTGGHQPGAKVLTTPAVRRMAAERGVDLSTVRGTGKQGRVLKEDLLSLTTDTTATAVTSSPTPTPPPPTSPQQPQDSAAAFVPLTGYAKAMRNSMEASNMIPALVITDEVDLTRLTALKSELRPHVRLTLLPFLVKATSLTLALHPRLNSTPNADYTAYRPNAAHNIGVAIDTPLGLAVPNLKNVQTLSVAQIGRRLTELRALAERGKLAPADVTGGTFTLSNMGSIAGSQFRPMILPPEVAIGALGRIKYRPRYDADGRLARTPVMDVSWAADHRMLDGAAVAKFFKDWKTYVENPTLILATVELAAKDADAA